MELYRERLIAAGEAFRADFAKAHPDNEELALMDAHLASLRAEPVKARNFAPGAVKDIERNHGVIFDPLNTSLARLVAARRPFWHITNGDDADFMNLVSRPTQIAIFPEPANFYVPDSNNKSLGQQRELLKVDEVEVMRKRMGIGGVDEVIDNVATHAGLVFTYFDNTKGRVRLHGQDYGYRYGRTETPTVGSVVADVGSFDEIHVHGLSVSDWPADEGRGIVWLVRLGVPSQE